MDKGKTDSEIDMATTQFIIEYTDENNVIKLQRLKYLKPI